MSDETEVAAARPPRISVITTNKNGERYLRRTIESVLAQDFTDFEHIIVDGASTDGSLEILKSYPHLRWVSEKDNSPNDGFRKGFAMARGEFIMIMCVSDAYLTPSWFRRCVETLDADPKTSLVWGAAVDMNEDGDICWLWNPHFLDAPPPDKQGFLPLWLATGMLYPELNYCVRRPIYLANFPEENPSDIISLYDPFTLFIFNFHMNGYLGRFLPIIAHCGRRHAGQHGQKTAAKVKLAIADYRRRRMAYMRDISSGRRKHVFRDGNGQMVGTLSKPAALSLPLLVAWHRISYAFGQVVRVGLVRRALRRFVGAR